MCEQRLSSKLTKKKEDYFEKNNKIIKITQREKWMQVNYAIYKPLGQIK